jgi:hypothetical protein
MFGKTRRDLAYYACEPDQRHHAQRSNCQPGHPASSGSARTLLDVVHGFFAERVFGPARRDLLAAQLANHAPTETPDRAAECARAPRKEISDIERRKRALVTELETTRTSPARPTQACSPLCRSSRSASPGCPSTSSETSTTPSSSRSATTAPGTR